MSHLYESLRPKSDYVDRKLGYSRENWIELLQNSTTVYVGNLTFYVTEDQLYELFSKCGEIDVIVMGLNKHKKIPCGFCFVKYFSHAAANRAVEYLNGILFDGRPIRVDWDSGQAIISEDRRFGRGTSGLQWRDEFRRYYDEGRGGEGGNAVFKQFQPRRPPNRKRPVDRTWEQYGDPNKRQRVHIALRRNLPPTMDSTQLKPDVSHQQLQPQDIKPHINANLDAIPDVDQEQAASEETPLGRSIKPESDKIME